MNLMVDVFEVARSPFKSVNNTRILCAGNWDRHTPVALYRASMNLVVDVSEVIQKRAVASSLRGRQSLCAQPMRVHDLSWRACSPTGNLKISIAVPCMCFKTKVQSLSYALWAP